MHLRFPGGCNGAFFAFDLFSFFLPKFCSTFEKNFFPVPARYGLVLQPHLNLVTPPPQNITSLSPPAVPPMFATNLTNSPDSSQQRWRLPPTRPAGVPTSWVAVAGSQPGRCFGGMSVIGWGMHLFLLLLRYSFDFGNLCFFVVVFCSSSSCFSFLNKKQSAIFGPQFPLVSIEKIAFLSKKICSANCSVWQQHVLKNENSCL